MKQAAVNIRKGKTIPVLELTIKAKWEVVENDNTCMAEGTVSNTVFECVIHRKYLSTMETKSVP